MGLLDGKVIVITGGAAGQGRAHALASAREGASVALIDVVDVDGDVFREVVSSVEALGARSHAIQASVSVQAELDAAFQDIVDVFGRIDGVILNAGIHRSSLFWETSEGDWDAIFDVNLKGAWRTAKAAAPHFIRQNDGGSIVAISSVDAFDPEVESTAYGVSKTGILGLTKYLGIELAPYAVRVNALAPGLIDTRMVQSQAFYDLLAGKEGAGTPQHLLDYAEEFVALGGVGLISPDEVANAAIFLNSDLSRTITGAVLPVDGGHMILNRKK